MRQDKTSRNSLIVYAVLIIPVMWAAIIAAPFLFLGDLSSTLAGLSEAIQKPFDITLVPETPKTILIFLVVYVMGIGIYISDNRNYRRGEEYGSAKWGNAKAICKKYRHPVFAQNKIFTQNVRMGLDGRKHRRTLNTCVIGGSGSGKTRFFCKPNLLNANVSYVCLDPKGELLRDIGYFLEQKAGYKIRVLDLVNMHKSHCYNPFHYLKDDLDVLKLVTNLIRNTTPKGSNSNDPFWERSEQALLEALILLLLSRAIPEEQNFPMVMELIGAAEVREDNEDYQSPLDELFERLEMEEPDNLAVKQYRIFKLAAGKTAKSILISLAVRLEKFNTTLGKIMTTDDLDLTSLGEEKTALFAVIPDNDSSLNFIIGMLYTQLFQQLYYQADHVHGGRLPVHVHFVMDEFPNVSLPDEFDKLISTMRSREISVSIILQNLAQLRALYEKQWESIIGNCDEILYLGGNFENSDLLVKMIGKESVAIDTYGISKGRNGSYSTNQQGTGRDLIDQSELRMMDNRDAILFIRGERPIKDAKFILEKHPNYRYTTDADAPNYEHGNTPYAIDWQTRVLVPEAEYELLSEAEFEELYLK